MCIKICIDNYNVFVALTNYTFKTVFSLFSYDNTELISRTKLDLLIELNEKYIFIYIKIILNIIFSKFISVEF